MDYEAGYIGSISRPGSDINSRVPPTLIVPPSNGAIPNGMAHRDHQQSEMTYGDPTGSSSGYVPSRNGHSSVNSQGLAHSHLGPGRYDDNELAYGPGLGRFNRSWDYWNNDDVFDYGTHRGHSHQPAYSEEPPDYDEPEQLPPDYDTNQLFLSEDWDQTRQSKRVQRTSSDEKRAIFYGRVLRVIFTPVFVLLTFLTGILARYSLMGAAYRIRPVQNDTYRSIVINPKISAQSNAENSRTTDVHWVWALIIMIGAPYVIGLIQGLYDVIFRRTEILSWARWIVDFSLHSIHCLGLCTLVFVILPRHDPIINCALLTSVASMPAVLASVSAVRGQKHTTGGTGSTTERNTVNIVLDIIGAVVQLGSVSAWAYISYRNTEDLVLSLLIVLGLVGVSCRSWQNYILQNVNDHNSNGPELEEHPAGFAWLRRKANLVVVTNLWNLLLVIGYPSIFFTQCQERCVRTFFFLDREAKNCSFLGEVHLEQQPASTNGIQQYVTAAINVVCSLMCYKIGKVACQVLMQKRAFSVPLTFVTPASIGLFIAAYAYTHNYWLFTILGEVDTKMSVEDYLLGLTTDHWLPVGFFSFLSLILVTRHVWRSPSGKVLSTKRLFIDGVYCAGALDQSLLLDRKRKDPVADETLHCGVGVEGREERDQKHRHPMVYVCATMWHENENEMKQLLKSLCRLDHYQYMRKLLVAFTNETVPDFFHIEMNIFMDDAFISRTGQSYDVAVNDHVRRMVKSLREAASSIHNCKMEFVPKLTTTPFGGRVEWRLPGGTPLVLHLKDKKRIRHKKRWSQVMYMYYLLDYKLRDRAHGTGNLGNLSTEEESTIQERAKHIYLLALDGDVDFQPEAVQILVDRMRSNPNIGAACGRIHPIGTGVLVWFQKFEYAVSHWFQKATEHVLGCVLCSPGCFSLFRASAVVAPSVVREYTTQATKPSHFVQYDQGEDRWFCTLLLKAGFPVAYCAASDSYTYCPESFEEFAKQRKRWTPSTMANTVDLLKDWKTTTQKNQNMSRLYMFYQLCLFVCSMVAPGTIFIVVVGAVSFAFPGVSLWVSLVLVGTPLVIFIILCFKASGNTQIRFMGVLALLFVLLMLLVIILIIVKAVDEKLCSISTWSVCLIAGLFLLTALLHPQETLIVFHGFFYFLNLPTASVLLIMYSLANLNDVSWGTREDSKPKVASPGGQDSAKGCLSQFAVWLTGMAGLELAQDRATDVEQGNSQQEREQVEKPPPPPLWTEDFETFSDKFTKDECSEPEERFWNSVIKDYLQPAKSTEEEKKQDIKNKEALDQLRNKVCLLFLMVNVILMVVTFVLQDALKNAGKVLYIPCDSGTPVEAGTPISMLFAAVFGVVLTVQFIGMLFHRLSTLLQVIAIAKNPGGGYHAIQSKQPSLQTHSEETGSGTERTLISEQDDQGLMFQAFQCEIARLFNYTERRRNEGAFQRAVTEAQRSKLFPAYGQKEIKTLLRFARRRFLEVYPRPQPTERPRH